MIAVYYIISWWTAFKNITLETPHDDETADGAKRRKRNQLARRIL